MTRMDKMTPAAVMLLMLAACGGGQDGNSSADGQATKWLGSSVAGSSEASRPVVGSSSVSPDRPVTSTPTQSASGDAGTTTAQSGTHDASSATPQPSADDANTTTGQSADSEANNATAQPATTDTASDTTAQPATAAETQPAAGNADTASTPSTGNTDTASTPAANADNTEIITLRSVRGDALAYALRNEVVLQDGQQEGGRSAHVRQWSLYPPGHFIEKPDMPAGTVERKIAPGDGTLDGKYTLTASLTLEDSPVPEHRHPSAQTYQISLSDIGPLPADVASSAADATVLEVGTKARASASFPATQDKAAKTYDVSLTANASWRISRSEMVKYSEPLFGWSTDDNAPAQEGVDGALWIEAYRGDSEREFEVCLKSNLFEDHRQENCTMWEVPANWAPGKHLIYKGQHVYNFLRVYRTGIDDIDWMNIDTEWRSELGITNAATAQPAAAAQ